MLKGRLFHRRRENEDLMPALFEMRDEHVERAHRAIHHVIVIAGKESDAKFVRSLIARGPGSSRAQTVKH